MSFFTQWLRKMFGPNVQGSRACRRGKSRKPRHRYVLRVEFLEDRLVPATLTVTSLTDGNLASLKGDGKLELREAIQLATHPGTTIDGFTTNDLASPEMSDELSRRLALAGSRVPEDEAFEPRLPNHLPRKLKGEYAVKRQVHDRMHFDAPDDLRYLRR